MLLFIIIILPLIITSIYLYFTQIINNYIIWWSIPISLIISFVVIVLLIILSIYIRALFIKTRNVNQSEIKRNSFFTSFISEIASILTLFMRVKIIIESKNKLPKEGPFMLVSNHQSMYDPIGLETILPEYKPFYVFKNNLMKVPIVGKILISSGHLPLDRTNARKAVETISAAIKRVENGESLFIYPEGTRNLKRELGELHSGTFKIALKAKCPIVILPTDGAGLLHKNYPFKKTTIVFRVSKVLYYEDIKDLSTKEIKEIVEKEFNENIENFREKYPFLKAGLW